MITKTFKFPSRIFGLTHKSIAVAAACLLFTAANLVAQVVVDTLSGGPSEADPYSYFGYADGDTASEAQFHTPSGIVADSSGSFLLVADRDNNAIRILDLSAGQTETLYVSNTNSINKPVGVALDTSNDVYVLNEGNGNNGTVVEIDNFGNVIATNISGLTNAGGIALDDVGNIYVTAGNSLFHVAGATITTVVTITNAGAALQGLVVKQQTPNNGLIAVCDSGRNGILLINPTSGVVTTNAGFHGAGDFPSGTDIASAPNAKFNQPMSVAEVGDGSLIVTDYGNGRVKVVRASDGAVTNLYAVTPNDWTAPYPGWVDGTVSVPDTLGGVAARLPFGVAFSPDGTVYVTEDYYHIIRKVTGGGFPTPPPPPPAPPAPRIGWVDFEGNDETGFFSVLHPVTTEIFNNDTLIEIDPGTNGVQTYYTAAATPNVGNPGPSNGGQPPYYKDGLAANEVQPLTVPSVPDLTIKAVSYNADGVSGPIVSAEFIFQVANPTITGNNASSFTVSDETSNVVFYYTTDGSTPTNDGSGTAIGPITNNPATISLNGNSNITFQVRGFRTGYFPSTAGAATSVFSPSNFVPNTISFGFTSGEASSAFVASPGQTFYAPVTLSPLPTTIIYSMQFNVTVTNVGPAPAITPGAYGFVSDLEQPDPTNAELFITIPPAMFVTGTGLESLLNYNYSENLLGVGWVERYSETNLYNTKSQDLIQYSQAHDTLFQQGNGQVILGGYAFTVPANAAYGQTYQIQIGRPSATSDGVGAPGSDVFIYAPTNGSTGAGAPLNSIKNVTVGSRQYIVGDVAPFRWFNAGDFGDTNLDNADVEQVFEAAAYSLNSPAFQAPGSDFFDCMDSAGGLGVDSGNGYLIPAGPVASEATLYDGNDTSINQNVFGDGTLDVSDVYVTFRRSLDPGLTWYSRFWTNDVANGYSGLAAVTTPNVFNPGIKSEPLIQTQPVKPLINPSPFPITNTPSVNFATTDYLASAGQVLNIPITAKVFGGYPLRVALLNISVVPLDGSPPLTTPISFTPNSTNTALGTPYITTNSVANYAAAWLDSTIKGISSSAVIGTLTVTIPANATSLSSYAIHFDHASGSPNGIVSFPRQTLTGLITLSSRTNSTYNDGIPDSWRLRYFGTVDNFLSVSNADADGDGFNNWQEYVAGTDPTDPKSYLFTGTDQSMAQSQQDSVIYWPSMQGKQYVIQCSPGLFPGSWTSISTNTGTGGNMEIHDASGGGVRFYRVQVQ
jgi:sugar lactone lactonase YvrE